MTRHESGGASAIAQAARTQNLASDPLVSAFVSASAGSGKTKLLIDRLLRLMLPAAGVDPETGAAILLPGSEPGRIQCLTFTKAAAAEMANRLQARLGRWVSLSDTALDDELSVLDVPATPRTRRAARELFGRVLDLPGGMKIGTIHAFCQSLLRRFPLEAAVNPHFTLLEDADAAMALVRAIETGLGDAASSAAGRAALGTLAARIGLDAYLGHIRALGADSANLTALLDRDPAEIRAIYARIFGVTDADPGRIAAAFVRPSAEGALKAVLQGVVGAGTATMQANVTAMLEWLATDPDARDPEIWRRLLLTKDGTPRAARSFVSAAHARENPAVMERIADEAARIVELDEAAATLRVLDLNVALFTLAAPVLATYRRDKAMRGQVDYDDLIASTRALLREPGAAWVLYKLDGGIDHLLLDEVQDTSDMQWEIAGALTDEFFVGDGAHGNDGRPRTVFAVGDYKQSIYAFQGADPDGFHLWRARFARAVAEGGEIWRDPGLNVSFRSVAPVLRLVDAVFAGEGAGHGLRAPGEILESHLSARPDDGGRVEIWPLVPVEEKTEAIDPWAAPLGNRTQAAPAQRLADELADWIARQIGNAPQPGQPPLRAGDVLVLVPRRSSFLRALVRALKGHGVEVATLVGVALTEQLAVQDVINLCEVLLLPQDDLALASALTSPLGGLSDESLMDLALGRGEMPLWTVLRARRAERSDWAAAWEMLSALLARIDFATPYQLLADILGRRWGRARLLARLGPEAAEPLDDLLAAALRFEAVHAPSMQAFLAWLRASNAVVRREADVAGDAVRIMTVHGAKGLQARLVILPDTTVAARAETSLFETEVDGALWPVWAPGGGLSTGLTRKLADAAREAARAEWNRLLYVALTRAADWLVICGWESGKSMPDTAWYGLCHAAFEALGADRVAYDGPWNGDRLVIEAPRTRVPSLGVGKPSTPTVATPALFGGAPSWRAEALRPEPDLTRPLVPSRPEAVLFGPEPAARSPLEWIGRNDRREAALRRGVLVHRVLQFLPEWDVAQRLRRTVAWLSRPAHGLDRQDVQRLAEQVVAIVERPDLAPLFAPGSRAEQALAGIVAGRVVTGQVDRVHVTAEAIHLCDYKTNRRPPGDGEDVPVAYRRQMAAYAGLLRQIYPGLPVRCSLVWTEGPAVSVLTEDQLMQALEDLT